MTKWINEKIKNENFLLFIEIEAQKKKIITQQKLLEKLTVQIELRGLELKN